MDRKLVETYRLALFGRMVMGVAHEVENHLSVVIGFSELIQMAATHEKKVVESAGKILAAGEKVGALMKHFSRHVRPHPRRHGTFVPGDVISEILLFARYDLGRNGVVVSHPSCPQGYLQGDARDFGLALLALLFNGAEAMAEKGGELSIGTTLDAAGWTITVSDRGTGIPPGLEEEVWKPGFSTKPEPFRTGMGLPVAKMIAEDSGGVLRIENRQDGGCRAILKFSPPQG